MCSPQPGLVFVLHGATGSGEEIAGRTGFDREADRLGWLAVYPDAHDPGPFGGWETFATPNRVDDVGFIATLIDVIGQGEGVDPAKVYATGFSRGGMLAYLLACRLADRLAAVAPVSANMGDYRGDVSSLECGPTQPLSLLAMHGTSDRNVPIEGGPSPDYPEQIHYAPLSDVVGLWRGRFACDPRGTVRRSGLATVRRWDCGAERSIELWVLEGGTHAWPGPLNAKGTADASMDASHIIADFFAEHSRR